MSGLFEHLAFDEEVHRAAARKALALARARATKRFANFLANGNRDERLALVAGDLTETVKQACADVYYDDWESVLASVQQHLGFTVESRKPKMCPVHREVTDISLQQGDPQAGFAAMAQHMFGEQSCRGTWEGGRCNFKPEMTTQSYWDQKAEKAEERRLERMREQEMSEQWDDNGGAQPHPDDATPDDAGPPVVDDDPVPVADPSEPIETDLQFTDSDWAMATEPASSESQMAMASTHEAEALKTVDIDQGGEGPSPKMDKRKWTPENVRFLDLEMDGSPHPTRHQDIAEPANYTSSDPGDDDGRFEQTNAGLEKQDVTKDSDYAGSAARGQQGGSFGGGGRSAVSATQVADPKLHPGSIQPLNDIHTNVGGLVVNGMPFDQFAAEYPSHMGRPATVEHANPQWEGIASQILEQGSAAPLRAFMATKAHNKGKHMGAPKPGCPLCAQEQQQGPVMAATDPDKNPITEFISDEEEQRALAEWREQ